ncbi:alpha/beta fold hydrolase [Sphingomonas xanthus]|uniref:Alpha/beta hydrolase n=1 Tax=Sphingomonas xanthus TaxID=2594473 RepID=A0A516IR49_9SPHN|nr:alpha/beta hydrolase [Sphingomonas xanthus]QDP19380.1 alpha/beta hydrolase [Sphingomonas xanthus]
MTEAAFGQMRLSLSSGIEMNVALAGPDDAPPVILLHGFPESHRTWRALAPLLADRFRLIMPDQRGFGDSDRPQEVEAYATERLLADLFALADAFDLDHYALVGHDWGGAIAWAAAILGESRISRLAIINSPHPLLFQKSQIESAPQRAASQYIRAFRDPDFEKFVEGIGFETFFDKSFASHVDLGTIPPDERATYIAQWSRPGALSAMLNWYRASVIVVPPPGETADLPDFVTRGLPKISVPVRIVWGLDDKALLPIQLDGVGEVGEDIEIFPLPGVGHFAPWQAPDIVAAALAPFLAGD